MVRGQTPAARAAACGVRALATCMTIRSRPIGVRRALLWMFIRSSSGTLKLRNLSFLDPDRMDNLWKAHSLDILFADDVVSVEAVAMPGAQQEIKGLAAVKGKHEWWLAIHEISSGSVTG